MDLIMVRHAKTVDNILKIYSRDVTPLDPILKLKLIETKRKLKEFNFKNIYVSELLRCRETLEQIIDKDKHYTVDPRINEFDYGDFKGHNYLEVNKKYPYIYGKLEKNTFSTKIPSGESYNDLFLRVGSFLQELKSKNEDVLIVSHDGVIRSILCNICGKDNFFKFSIENAKITVVSFMGNYSFIKKINY